MAVPDERFQTGNHVRVFVNGAGARQLLGDGVIGVLGKGTGLNMTTRTGAQYTHIIGTPEPQDINETRHEYHIRLDTLRLRAENPSELIKAGRVDIESYDQFNGRHVATAEECALVEGTLNIPANERIARNLTFLALRTK